ncbi:MAG: hypothetical protein JSR77_00105 [Planctomycetes bacterium]|nr:hypothetical protein [Planctomycetota bacterium]
MPPQPTLAPYNTSRGEVLWAVAPPRNESGTTFLDVLAVGDALVTAAEEVRGVRCVPLNRTLEAMQALKMEYVATPADARRLAQAMQVDAVVVSSVTAYDPYKPSIGLGAALYARPGALETGAPSTTDSRKLATMTTDSAPVTQTGGDRPLATTSEHFDSRNNQVLADVKTYAEGRQKRESALGWRSYAASAERFTEFASYRTIQSLVQQEWIRHTLGQTPVTTKPDNKPVASRN